jgi:hypothetical protein
MVLYSQGRDTAGNFERSKTPPPHLGTPAAGCAGGKSQQNRANCIFSLCAKPIAGSRPARRAKPAYRDRTFHARRYTLLYLKLLPPKVNMWRKNRS